MEETMKNDVSLTHAEIRRLGRLRHLYPDPYDCATALLEDLEAKQKPIDALATAQVMVFEIARVSGEEFWERVGDALETIESEDEPEAVLFYSNGGEHGDPEYPHEIGRYRDDTEGDFEVVWVPTDAWRGHYDVRAAKGSNWVRVHDDVILAYSEDERDLKSFDDFLRGFMDAGGIEYVRAFARSSNVFSSGYDLFVEKEHAEAVERIIRILKPIYRDDFRFAATAISGKDPDDWDAKDLTLTRIALALFDTTESNPKVLKERVFTELVDAGVPRESAESLVTEIFRKVD